MDCDKFSAIDLMVDVYYKITEMISVYFLLKNQILQLLFNIPSVSPNTGCSVFTLSNKIINKKYF